jgi:hypothetical protein
MQHRVDGDFYAIHSSYFVSQSFAGEDFTKSVLWERGGNMPIFHFAGVLSMLAILSWLGLFPGPVFKLLIYFKEEW